MKLVEKNVGKISGLSSYELAVRTGAFSGSLEEYINKETQVYQDMVKRSDDSVAEMKRLLASATDVDSDTNSEIVASRGEYGSLMDRLDENDELVQSLAAKLDVAIPEGEIISDAMIDEDGYLMISVRPSSEGGSFSSGTVELRRAGSQIQWRENKSANWKTLMHLRDLMPKITSLKVNEVAYDGELSGELIGDPDSMKLVLNIPRGKDGCQILDANIHDDDGCLWMTIANNDFVTVDDTGLVNGLPILSIGEVKTVDFDQPASASITGTPMNPVLNLTIPRGPTTKLTRAYLGDDGFLVFDYDKI